MHNTQISIARPEDARLIRQIQHDVWLTTYPNEALGITLQEIQARVAAYITPEAVEYLQKSLANPDQMTWLANLDSKIVGYCMALKGEETNQITAIYILEEYHGKGLGKALIEPALNWLGTAKPIEVEVASYNAKAIRFYNKHGFRDSGKIGDYKGIPTISLVRDTTE